MNQLLLGSSLSLAAVLLLSTGCSVKETLVIVEPKPPVVVSGNTLPIATPQSVTMNEDTSKAITLTGTDGDGDALTFSIVTPPNHGTFSNGTYTPSANYHGSDSFTFKANDTKADSQPATVNVTINDVAETIYEDGSNLANWTPSESSSYHIGTISESSGTIKISTTKKSARYKLLKDSAGANWDNSSEFMASWNLKTDARYEVMFLIRTQNNGEVYVVYSNTAPIGSGHHWDANSGVWKKDGSNAVANWGKYSYNTIADSADGVWHTQKKDLLADLQKVNAFKDDEIVSVKHALVINWDKDKDIYIEDIKLSLQ